MTSTEESSLSFFKLANGCRGSVGSGLSRWTLQPTFRNWMEKSCETPMSWQFWWRLVSSGSWKTFTWFVFFHYFTSELEDRIPQTFQILVLNRYARIDKAVQVSLTIETSFKIICLCFEILKVPIFLGDATIFEHSDLNEVCRLISSAVFVCDVGIVVFIMLGCSWK